MPEHLDQRQLLERAAKTLLDPKGQAIARAVQWWDLPSACDQTHEPWPVAVLGSGAPVLLLHGFDSSHLEFRRLSPLLSDHAQLFIPD
ncbi:MAG: alpha/beta hydrolase, partial [Synechococcaceae bacterium WB7_3xG_012]|nr:alpha/beta hydrolase [Synechococcaceae bacterium WB7_3xG_012]